MPSNKSLQALNGISAGGEGARAVMQDLFPTSIWLQPDPSNRFLIAILGTDGAGALFYDWHDCAGEFPIVGNSMVAGAGFEKSKSKACRPMSFAASVGALPRAVPERTFGRPRRFPTRWRSSR
jgi:hypothetical protein